MKKILIWAIPIVFCLAGLGIGYYDNDGSNIKNFTYAEVQFSEHGNEYYINLNGQRVYLKNIDYVPYDGRDSPSLYPKQNVTVYDVNNITYYTDEIVTSETVAKNVKDGIILTGVMGLFVGLVFVVLFKIGN